MKNQRNGNFVRNSLFYVIVVLGIMGLIYWVAGPSQTTSTKTISTSTFMTELRDKKIKTITIQPGAGVYDVKGEYRKAQTDKSSKDDSLVSLVGGASNKVTGFETQVISNDPIMESLQKAADKTKTEITTKPEASNFWGNMAISFLPILLMIGVFYLMMGGMSQGGQGGRGNMMGFGKSKAKPADPSENKVRFADVAGAEEEKQ